VLPAPMVALRGAPAQFLFDLGAMGALGSRQGHGAGRFVAVASAVAADLDGGLLPSRCWNACSSCWTCWPPTRIRWR
jgi:hypothetical protein